MPDLAIHKLIISENRPDKLTKIQINAELSSLNAASSLLPKGVYTTFRTYEGNKLLPLEYHLERLENSAKLLGFQIHIDEQQVYEALREAVRDYLPNDTRIRLTATLFDEMGDMYISIEPLKSPSKRDYEMGVSTVTVPLHREIPEAKQTIFIHIAEQIRRQLPAEAHEGLLLDEQGHILEGFSSNFFYIRDQILWTAPRDVLSGITRSLVLDAAASEGIPVLFKAAKMKEIPTFVEAFLTSSTRAILPVVKVDRHIVGSGDVGQLTKRLSKAYWKEIKSHLVSL
jgi:branched-chain amino acid aminotransferase